jgi:hypothetical protein
MSFSARGYHDQPMGYHEQQTELSRFDTRLTTVEETQQDIQNTVHQHSHSQWQAEVGDRLTSI